MTFFSLDSNQTDPSYLTNLPLWNANMQILPGGGVKRKFQWEKVNMNILFQTI